MEILVRYLEEILYSEGKELLVLEQVAQRNCGCPILRCIQGQDGWALSSLI